METTTQSIKALHTARTYTKGGREYGVPRGFDGHLDIKLSTPGNDEISTIPEQLFATAYKVSSVPLESNCTIRKSFQRSGDYFGHCVDFDVRLRRQNQGKVGIEKIE